MTRFALGRLGSLITVLALDTLVEFRDETVCFSKSKSAGCEGQQLPLEYRTK